MSYLSAGVPLHITGVCVDLPITATERSVPLGPGTAGGAGLRAVCTGAVVAQIHAAHAVLHHQVAVVDVRVTVCTTHLSWGFTPTPAPAPAPALAPASAPAPAPAPASRMPRMILMMVLFPLLSLLLAAWMTIFGFYLRLEEKQWER